MEVELLCNTAYRRSVNTATYLSSFYCICRWQFIFIMLLPKKFLIVGFYLQKYPVGVRVLSVSVLTTPYK